jgi:hypothetical protein
MQMTSNKIESTVALPTHEPDGEFSTFRDWIRRAPDAIGGMNALCADAQGRACRNGRDFVRARDEKTFPVRYWFGEGRQSTAKQWIEVEVRCHPGGR